MGIGITLQGGGLKGVAHIGALQALEELGIKIDYISGTSSGAMIAAMYAMEYSPNEIKQITKAIINPGIIGTVIGVLLFVFSVTLPKILAMPIEFLAALNTPVPMLIIGFYLANTNLKYIIKSKDAYPAVALRLIIIPLLLIFILKILGVPKIILTSVTISVCAPAAAITTMMSAKYNHNTKLSAGIVSGSTALSLITMPIMISLAQYI